MGKAVYPELSLCFLLESQPLEYVIHPSEPVTIGKDVADLDLESYLQRSPLEFISRQHATIGCDDDGWFIKDHSMNGTWLNGFRLPRGQRFPLRVDWSIVLPDQVRDVQIRIKTKGTTLAPPTYKNLCRYHQQQLRDIVSSLESLRGVHLVGPSGIGKNIILNELIQPGVYTSALNVPQLLSCDLDLRRLPEYEVADFYMLVGSNLLVTVRTLGKKFNDLVGRMERLLQEFHNIRHESAYCPLLIRTLQEIGEVAARRVVFVVRHFEVVMRHLNPTILADMQAMHRIHVWQPLFVVASCDSFTQTASEENTPEISGLSEIFDNSRWLAPLEASDLRQYLHLHTRAFPFSESEIALIAELSGGWPSIARAIADELRTDLARFIAMNRLRLLDHLLQIDSVSAACAAVISDLSGSERQLLKQLALGQIELAESDGSLIDRVVNKGIMNRTENYSVTLRSSMLEYFVRHDGQHVPISSSLSGASIDSVRGIVWINGHELSAGRDLSPLEFQLLAYLLTRPNEVVSIDDVLLNVYNDEDCDAGGDGRVRRLIGRLRKKVENDPTHPTVIENVRGHGIRLNQLPTS